MENNKLTLQLLETEPNWDGIVGALKAYRYHDGYLDRRLHGLMVQQRKATLNGLLPEIIMSVLIILTCFSRIVI